MKGRLHNIDFDTLSSDEDEDSSSDDSDSDWEEDPRFPGTKKSSAETKGKSRASSSKWRKKQHENKCQTSRTKKANQKDSKVRQSCRQQKEISGHGET